MDTLWRTEIVHVASFGNLIMIRWSKRATPEIFRAVTVYEREFHQKLGSTKAARITIVSEAAIGKPDKELRRAVDERADEAEGWYASDVLVMEADGFAAALLRSLIAARMIIKPPSTPYKVTHELTEGCDFLAPYVLAANAAKVSGAELRAMIATPS